VQYYLLIHVFVYSGCCVSYAVAVDAGETRSDLLHANEVNSSPGSPRTPRIAEAIKPFRMGEASASYRDHPSTPRFRISFCTCQFNNSAA
jgi:hypothetical protein